MLRAKESQPMYVPTISPAVLVQSHALHTLHAAEGFTGIEYNEPTRSYQVWRRGHIVAWAATESVAREWLHGLERKAR
jgi:hypothetical protein